VPENEVMRWLAQRAPTVDNDRIYVSTARGEVVCLQVHDGKELWRKDYRKDFEGRSGTWGFGDRPLVDDNALICVPGGTKATVVALNKKTGDVLWKCAVPEGDTPEHGATVRAVAGGVGLYLVSLQRGLVGVRASDGKLLWRYTRLGGATANCYTPIVSGARVLTACGYNKGIALLALESTAGEVKVKEQFYQQAALPPWHEALIEVELKLYYCLRGKLTCLELETRKVLWEERCPLGPNVAMTAAEERLYLRSPNGQVALVAASGKAFALYGSFQVPDAQAKSGTTAPVVAGGRLYLRDDDRLFVHDIKEGTSGTGKAGTEVVPAPGGPAPRKGREADAVFVPTPQDVVEKMLELAGVRKADVVYDLGCGDGRIVVTAARKYGCRAAGFDIDRECVRLSRANVAKAGVEKLVTIEHKDIFTLDLAEADVITLYLLPRMNERLLPQLAKLKPGSRIVCHANPIPGIRPEKVVAVVSREDELAHKVYVYVTPLKRE